MSASRRGAGPWRLLLPLLLALASVAVLLHLQQFADVQLGSVEAFNAF
jgi:hypothetical protein